MAGSAGADLAVAVSKAGGVGQVGATNDLNKLAGELAKVEAALERYNGMLPVGVGLLSFILKTEDTLPILERFKPAVVWIFAARELGDYAGWAEKIRAALPKTQVWIQVGSVEGALAIAKEVRPDAMCIQGIDAGGE